jgi:uncharacterized protein
VHTGSLLILLDGVYAWPIRSFTDVKAANLEAVLITKPQPELLLLGTGAAQHFPTPELHSAFTNAKIPIEAMDTGAACRTYNLLLNEGRAIVAALIALT